MELRPYTREPTICKNPSDPNCSRLQNLQASLTMTQITAKENTKFDPNVGPSKQPSEIIKEAFTAEKRIGQSLTVLGCLLILYGLFVSK
uniref:Uncharacterized protein n=1 Tax=viral metagenome TaxID=1070528 RepID=A0A6C0APH3_9ZZZZ